MCQCTDCVVIEIKSCHCATGDSPSTCVLCTNCFQVGFEEVECITWRSCSNHLSRFLYEMVEVNCWFGSGHLLCWYRLGYDGRNGLVLRNNGGWCGRFYHRFRFVVKQCRLALKGHFNDFCCCHDFRCCHQFTELKVFITIIMVNGLGKDSVPVRGARFFHHFLDLCFAERLGRFDYRHLFNFHRFTASLAPSLEFGKRWMSWEENKSP